MGSFPHFVCFLPPISCSILLSQLALKKPEDSLRQGRILHPRGGTFPFSLAPSPFPRDQSPDPLCTLILRSKGSPVGNSSELGDKSRVCPRGTGRDRPRRQPGPLQPRPRSLHLLPCRYCLPVTGSRRGTGDGEGQTGSGLLKEKSWIVISAKKREDLWVF